MDKELKKLILINKSTTSADNKADLLINDDIAKVMQEVIENISVLKSV